jgi:ketosteroid isomerase-like protein
MCVSSPATISKPIANVQRETKLQRRDKVKKVAVAALVVLACVGLVQARPQAASTASPAKAAIASQAITQLEHDWEDAAKAGDAGKVSAILADDWVRIAPDGKMETKKDALASLKSGASKVTSDEPGPMDIKVMGKVAVVQATSTEKSTFKGKDTSGKYAWTDVLENVGGKWVVVRSEATLVK